MFEHDGTPGGCKVFTLSAATSQDIDSDELTYNWSLDNSTWTASGEEVSTDSLCINQSDESAVYYFTLEVCDGYDVCSSDNITITLTPEANEAPVASIDEVEDVMPAVNCNDDDAFTSFTLSSSSTDVDGDPLSCSWEEVGGAYFTSTSCTAIVEDRAAGLYTFNLVVSDAYGASDSASIEVVVLEESAQNQPPVADAGPVVAMSIPHDGIPGGFDTFDLVSESTDDCDDGELSYLTCEWTNMNGPYFYSDQCETTVDLEANAEEYQFLLTVTDPYGLNDSVVKRFLISTEDNFGPYGLSVENQSGVLSHDGLPGGCDVFTMEASANDPENDNLTFHWNEADGCSQTTDGGYAECYFCEGVHVNSIASDPRINNNTETFTFTVHPEDNVAPDISITGNESEYQLSMVVSLEGFRYIRYISFCFRYGWRF